MSLRPDIVVIGASAGGVEALCKLLSGLSADFACPLAVVQHMAADSDDFIARRLDARCPIRVCEAEHGQRLRAATAYVAPANYHLLFEDKQHLALSADERVNHSRPSIDVLFESAAMVFGAGVVAVVLTGANHDGARGAARIQAAGGRVLVQQPQEAEVDVMPRATIESTQPEVIAPLVGLAELLTIWSRYE